MSENNKLTIEEALAVTAGAVKKWIEENPEIGSSGNSIYVFMGDVREDLNSGSATGKWSESKLNKPTDRPLRVGDLILDFSNNLCSVSSVYDDGTFNLAYIHNIGTGGTGDGTPGKDGTTFYPHVSEDGVLSWTNDGGLPNPPSVDIKCKPEIYIGSNEPTGGETIWIDTSEDYLPQNPETTDETEGVYKLIDTVTMTDAAQSLSINREPDGTSYQFKAMMVKMQKPATTAGYTLQCYTYHANGKNLRTVLNFNSASAMGARIENYPRMGYFTGGGYAPSVAYSNSGTAIALPNAAEMLIPIDQPITSLYFLAYGDAVIPAGSTFEIWGVRA